MRRLTILAVVAALATGCGGSGFDTKKWEQGAEARPPLVADAVDRLHLGMSKADVRDLLGRPDYTAVNTRFNASGFRGEQWTWLVGESSTFRVVFNFNGRIKQIQPPRS